MAGTPGERRLCLFVGPENGIRRQKSRRCDGFTQQMWSDITFLTPNRRLFVCGTSLSRHRRCFRSALPARCKKNVAGFLLFLFVLLDFFFFFVSINRKKPQAGPGSNGEGLTQGRLLKNRREKRSSEENLNKCGFGLFYSSQVVKSEIVQSPE